jgi:hypothetical protein
MNFAPRRCGADLDASEEVAGATTTRGRSGPPFPTTTFLVGVLPFSSSAIFPLFVEDKRGAIVAAAVCTVLVRENGKILRAGPRSSTERLEISLSGILGDVILEKTPVSRRAPCRSSNLLLIRSLTTSDIDFLFFSHRNRTAGTFVPATNRKSRNSRVQGPT